MTITQARTETLPTVGGLATIHLVTDSYPLMITRVSASGKTFWGKPLDDTGAQVAYRKGPFPVIEQSYSEEEAAERVKHDAPEKRVYKGPRGWHLSGKPTIRVSVGKAVVRIDYSQ